ncbi:MAG: zeta toxin family protein [Prolixibacteraceae bacterium]
MLNCQEFVNADEIAKGLSPFQPDNVAIMAGRIMLNRIKDLVNQNVDFAFETTLATKSYVKLIQNAQSKGYFVTLVYFWLNSPLLAVERVKNRVISGGHNIPENVIFRRYSSGIKNLSKLYLPICDYWLIIDNSEPPFQIIAEGIKTENIEINNQIIYNQIVKL